MNGTNLNRVLYLTGSSGFLGGYLCKEFDKNPTIATVYCPIRTKKGMTGPERLATLLPYEKCTYVGIHDPIPPEVTHVVLNAYSTRFDESIRKKLKENVEPIMELLDQCKHLPNLQCVVFVSTAYVQPPLPFKRLPESRLPLLLMTEEERKNSPWKNARQVYETILESRDVDDDDSSNNVVERHFPNLHPYYKSNSYVFSKHLLESMLEEEYMKHFNVCIVRPSMIAPPRTLDYGLLTKSAAPLMMQLSQLPIIFAPKTSGKPNVVFLEEVHDDILVAMDSRCKGKKKIDLISSTGVDNDIPAMWKASAPHIPRFTNLKDGWLMQTIRTMEYWFVYVVLGSKTAGLLQAVYENYDFFLDHVWDFEHRHPIPCLDLICELKQVYFKNFALAKKEERLQKQKGRRSGTNGNLYYYVIAAVLVLMLSLMWKEE